MKRFIVGLLLGLALPLLAGLVFILSGGMPVATKAPPLPLERWVARKAIHAAIKEDAAKAAPFAADEKHLLAGAEIYERNCAVCHGMPNQSATAIAKGLFPRPPRLFEHHGVSDDPVGETYWKIKNGLRLTGMPGFGDALTEQELWEVSLLLLHAPKLPDAVTKELTSDD